MDHIKLESSLAAMQRVGASTLHLVAGRPPCVRVQRRVVELDAPQVTPEQVDEFVRDLLFADHRRKLAECGQVQILYMGHDRRRYQVKISAAADARTITFRSLPTVVPTLLSLDLPEQVGTFVQHGEGLVLVAGFFGSGKGTTLAALVNLMSERRSRHIVVIEDSIEFVHDASMALVHQQEIGTHVESASDGVRQAVETGADAIVVSSVDDPEVFQAALIAAESGCMVVCGVEVGSVVGAVSEFVAGFPIEERARARARLARVLRCGTSQLLLPRAHKPGRVPVMEILIGSPAARAVIKRGEFEELLPIMQRYRGVGMQTTGGALHSLHASHLISAEDAQLHQPSSLLGTS